MRKAPLFVFFDIETLTVNRKAEPKEQLVMEYVVSYKYLLKGKEHEGVKPTLEAFIKYLLTLKEKHIILLAHNGEGYDFSFLRRALVYEFGLIPKNAYLRNSTNHELETKIKDEKHNYLHVSRVKSATRTRLEFRIDGVKFETKDTLPITHMKVKVIGELLKDLHLDDNGKNVKLNYDDDYAKYDLDKPLSYAECKKYCKKVFDQLNKHALDYVMNDTRVIYQMFHHYNEIYASTYDPTKLTLSQNILTQYELNDLARFQLVNKVRQPDDKYRRLELTTFLFNETGGGQRQNVFEFIHRFYKGGLNFYNDRYVGKLVHEKIVHIDLNSSYPTVMRYREFPTFLVDGGTINKELTFDKDYYYYIQISKIAFQNLIIKQIKSKVVRQMFVKYFNNDSDSVYIQTPHIKMFSSFMKQEITHLPAIAYLKFEKAPFGGLDTIQYNYQKKTSAKKRHAPKGEVAGYKVTLNGIYGIPALRPFFPLYEYDPELKKTVSVKDKLGNFAFHNSERNITFASSVTAWAILQLLTPLTYNIKGIDKHFYYCDTDSIFMSASYWSTVKNKVQVDPYALGAWDLEHKEITDLYVLNHKKYALWSNDNNKVEVFAGGIPIKAFHAEKYNNLRSFVKATFHDGSKIKNLRNAFTKDKVVVLYEAETEITKGGKYKDHFPRNKKEQEDDVIEQAVIRILLEQKEKNQEDDSSLYYETPIGQFSRQDIFPPIYENDLSSRLSFRSLIRMHNIIKRNIRAIVDIKDIDTKRREAMQL